MKRRHGLSKSKIAAYEQCPKRLWLQVHRPDEAVLDEGSQARFAAGHEVGALACELVPSGTMIEAEPDIATALARTAEFMAEGYRSPIFEATFEREGVLVRVDIMEPDQFDGWHVAEVKSSTGAKDYQLSDLATQVWVMRGAGVKLTSACIRHINRDFVYRGDGDYQALLIDAPAGESIEPLIAMRAEVAKAARETLQGPEPPREPGSHCTQPFSCQFQDYCNRGRPLPAWPISLLPNTGRRIAEKWAEKGIVELTDLPEGSFSNDLHARVHRATISGETFHDCKAALAATAGWSFPRTWLDFETIAFVVPRWAGTRPYEQVPFQFSAHVEEADCSVSHRDFLSLDGTDPRRACAEALIALVPDTGAVVAYNASFERSCIRRLAAVCPDLAQSLLSMADRVVDLLPVAKACWYHRDQRGSWSIKAVLPTIGVGLGYKELSVQDGSAAQLAYAEAVDPNTAPDRKAEIDQALREYCRRDTEAMIALYRVLVGKQLKEPPRIVQSEPPNGPCLDNL